LKDAVVVDAIYGIDISSKMVDRAREKQCYTDLYVEDLASFFARVDIGPNSLGVNVIVAADVFVYFDDFWEIVDAGLNSLVVTGTKEENTGPCIFAFTVEKAFGLSDGPLFRLQSTGRFVHDERYIRYRVEASRSTLLSSSFTTNSNQFKRPVDLVSTITEVQLRKNNGVGVIGLLVTLKVIFSATPPSLIL
jgi:predicted TPR repeat methyltransferase